MLRFRALWSLLVLLSLGCEEPVVPPIDAGADAGGPESCGDDTGAPVAVFVLPTEGDESGTLFQLPWPTDLRRTSSGTIDVSTFPNPRRNPFVSRYLDAATARLDGYGNNAAVYFRFSREIDEASLDENSVFIIDVDGSSPDLGARHPGVLHYHDCPTVFWSAHTVAVRPVYGLPLASARRYAAVVTRDVTATSGETLERDEDFEALIGGGGGADVEAARAVYGDVFDRLDAAGIARDDLLAVTVFTTQDATGELLAIRDWMVDNYPEPNVVAGSARIESVVPRFTDVRGSYGPNPIFQAGEVPYTTEGGAIDLDGTPVVHGEFEARFALSVPSSPMPPEGYPIVLYAHGTSGSFRTVIRNDTAIQLARLGIAAMGVDQIHHGDRNPTGTDPSLLFFNVPNPDAARDNTRQSALDVVQQRRLVANLTFDTSLIDRDGLPVRFDPSRIYFMGHSQGGLNGPIFLAIDDGAQGGVLSAASAVITPALIDKIEPVVIPNIVRTLLNLPGANWEEAFMLEDFVYEHPVASLVQTYLEVSDSSNYAHMIFDQPRPGFAPKSVLMTEGLMDEFSPPISIEALAASMRIPQIEPVHSPVPGLVLRGVSPGSAPATGNVAGGMATAGLLQFPMDGHFAVFENDDAIAQVFGFFDSLAMGAPGTIPAAP